MNQYNIPLAAAASSLAFGVAKRAKPNPLIRSCTGSPGYSCHRKVLPINTQPFLPDLRGKTPSRSLTSLAFTGISARQLNGNKAFYGSNSHHHLDSGSKQRLVEVKNLGDSIVENSKKLIHFIPNRDDFSYKVFTGQQSPEAYKEKLNSFQYCTGEQFIKGEIPIDEINEAFKTKSAELKKLFQIARASSLSGNLSVNNIRRMNMGNCGELARLAYAQVFEHYNGDIPSDIIVKCVELNFYKPDGALDDNHYFMVLFIGDVHVETWSTFTILTEDEIKKQGLTFQELPAPLKKHPFVAVDLWEQNCWTSDNPESFQQCIDLMDYQESECSSITLRFRNFESGLIRKMPKFYREMRVYHY